MNTIGYANLRMNKKKKFMLKLKKHSIISFFDK